MSAPVKVQARPARRMNLSLQVAVVAAMVMTITAAILALITTDFSLLKSRTADCPQPSPHSNAAHGGWLNTDVSAASQGKLWKPTTFRTFPRARTRFDVPLPPRPEPPARAAVPRPACDNWAVVTTIFEPTHLLHQLRNLSSWCLVVVGDRKTNHSAWRDFVNVASDKVVYLSDEKQKQLPYKISAILPWDHFGRKNVGYVYAVHHGAKFIWDTDDDNVLKDPERLTSLVTKLAANEQYLTVIPSLHHLWNPYPHFRSILPQTAAAQDISWPRGFPLPFVKDSAAASIEGNGIMKFSRVRPHQIGVYQSLADNDPDVDALYRLTRHTPLSFLPTDKGEIKVLPLHRVAPFNAQATLWVQPAFWGLLLPVTVHGRVTDIWRSYIVQKLMTFCDLRLAFVAPLAIQYRNVHSLVADLQSEVPLYTQADELVRWLHEWKPHLQLDESASKTQVFLATVEQLFIDLYEIGILEEDDVSLVQAWLDDLLNVGYDFSELVANRADNSRTTRQEFPEPDATHVAKVAVCMFEWGNSSRSQASKNGSRGTIDQHLQSPERFELTEFKGITSVQKNIITNFGENNVDVFVFGDRTKGLCSDMGIDAHGKDSTCREYSLDRKHIPKVPESSLDGLMRPATDKGGISQLKYLQMLAACEEEIGRRVVENNLEYDWVIGMGTNDHVLSIASKNELAMDASLPTIWHGSKTVCCCDNEWRFAVGRRGWMREYLNYYWRQDEGLSANISSSWPSEQDTHALRKYLMQRGIDMKEHAAIEHCA